MAEVLVVFPMIYVKYNPEIHHRHSIRLKGYDYSQAGAYFVTICTQNRECLFGDVVGGDMVNNIVGRMIETAWLELPNRFPYIDLDEFIVMPNHFHGIIVLSAQRRGESCIRPNPGDHNPGDHNPGDHNLGDHNPGDHNPGDHNSGDHNSGDHNSGDHNPGDHNPGDHKDRPYGTSPDTLGRIFQAFKSITTHTYINNVKHSNWPPFPDKLWQRNYYEHIIRDEHELIRIREYILQNPAKWDTDRENPMATAVREPPQIISS